MQSENCSHYTGFLITTGAKQLIRNFRSGIIPEVVIFYKFKYFQQPVFGYAVYVA